MLLPGQSLRGMLPLLSPAFRHSKLSRQVHPRLQDARVELWARILSGKFSRNDDFHAILGSFTCRKVRHGTDGFTSPPKEGVLRMFFALKIRRLRPGLNLRTWLPEASMLIPRPPKLPSYFFLISYHAVTLIMPPQIHATQGAHVCQKPQTHRVLIFVVDQLKLEIFLLTAGSVLGPCYEI